MSALKLRPASADDAIRLLTWANAVDSLANKRRTSSPIDMATHLAWLDRRLADAGTRLFIVERDGDSIGQVRLQVEAGAALVDIYIEPQARRGGVAGWAVAEALRYVPVAQAGTARAEVRAENQPSRRLFERLGFNVIDTVDGFVIYEYPLPQDASPC